MKLITVATHSEFYFPWLKMSCQKNGVELVVLGWGEKWQGFTWKFKLMKDYLKSLPHDEIVCFIDGYDVIVLKPLHDMEKLVNDVLQQTSSKIIVAQDIQKNPIIDLITFIYFGKCKDNNLNSGTYAGRAKDIYDILSQIYNQDNVSNSSDDQQLLTQYCIKQPLNVHIDASNQFFLTILDPLRNIKRHLHYDNNIVSYNNSTPYLIHAPGMTCLNSLLKTLGYPMSPSQEQEIFNYKCRTLLKKPLYYIKNFPLYVYLILLVLIFYLIRKKLY